MVGVKNKAVLLIAGLLGSFLSIYAFFLTIEVRTSITPTLSFCSVNELFDCNIVAGSEASLFLGIPVAGWSLIYYLWVISVVILILFSKTNQIPTLTAALVVSSLALTFTIYKAFVMLFHLNVVCLVCTSLYFINVTIFILILKLSRNNFKKTTRGSSSLFKKLKNVSYRKKMIDHIPGLFSAIVVFLIGYFVFNISFQNKNLNKIESEEFPNNSISKNTENTLAKYLAETKRSINIVSDAPMWGNDMASVTIVEFSDFQCPFCQIAATKLRELLSQFKHEIKLYFIHYPLDKSVNPNITTSGHKYAGLAACAATFAYDRGQFWQFHDDLFQQQQGMNSKTILTLAKSYGWKISEFESAVKSVDMINRVKRHIKCGQEIGVQGTPTIYVNGRLVEQWHDSNALRVIIEHEIQNSI